MTTLLNFIVEIFMVFTLVTLVASSQLYIKKVYDVRQVLCFATYLVATIALVTCHKMGYWQPIIVCLMIFILWVLLMNWYVLVTEPEKRIGAFHVLTTAVGTVGWGIATLVCAAPEGDTYWGYVFSATYLLMMYGMDLVHLTKDYHDVNG